MILDEAQNIKNPETKQARAARALPGRLPHRADRHAGREPRRRPVVAHGVPQSRLPGHAGASSSGSSSCRSRPTRDRGGGGAAASAHRPFILRRLKTDKSIIADLPDKLEMKVFCTLTKEQASLYAAVVEDAEAGHRGGRGHPAQGPGPGDAVQAEAGLQSSGAVPRRQLRDPRPLAASWRG